MVGVFSIDWAVTLSFLTTSMLSSRGTNLLLGAYELDNGVGGMH